MNPRLNSHPVVRDFFWLTKYTNPHGSEERRFTSKLESLGAYQDDHGNFFIDIDLDKSRTVFAAHLDTADSGGMKRVRRVVNGDIISTDGKTILGADDRAGVAILLHLIRNRVPGRYAFFVGEERGRVGSSASAKDTDFWYGLFDRMIMWDRYGQNSIITYQSGQQSASSEFADVLAQFYRHASNHTDDSLPTIVLEADDGGLYTDSYSFYDLIPECTNLSVGYSSHHTVKEVQDARFLASMAEASIIVPWEELPTAINMDERDYLYVWSGGWGSMGSSYDSAAHFWEVDPYPRGNSLRRMSTVEDLIDAAMYHALSKEDVTEFVWNHPDEAIDLLYDFLQGNAYNHFR